MRVVERAPWAEKRDATHDAMCLAVAKRADLLFPKFTGAVKPEIEAPVGRGFVDVLAWTDAPDEEREYAIVEVKTNTEKTTGGDVIRQLRYYREHIARPASLILVVPNMWFAPNAMIDLILEAGVEILPVKYFTEAM